MSRPTRRRLLRGAIPAAGFASLAGCGSLGGSGTRLRELFVENLRSSAETVEVALSVGDRTVYENTVEVPAERRRQLDCDWPPRSAAYELRARVVGGEWQALTIGAGGDACISVDLDREGQLTFRQIAICPTSASADRRCG